MKKIFVIVTIFGLLGGVALAFDQNFSAYREIMDLGRVSVGAPTVVEVPLGSAALERQDLAVYDESDKIFEPYHLVARAPQVSVVASSPTHQASNLRSLVDGMSSSYVELPVSEDGVARAEISLVTSRPVTTSELHLYLDQYVALPLTVALKTGDKVVVAERRLDSTRINFPQTTATSWLLTLTYNQPLRINEITLDQINQIDYRAVRFLAQPNHQYKIYLNPDRSVEQRTSEAGNLAANEGVVKLAAKPIVANVVYIPSDYDMDGVPDSQDNCVTLANKDQADEDGNGRGDGCDDYDKDGRINAEDNCPAKPNANQLDTDGDKIGDACDGEESRLTEKYPWFPWLGLGLVALVLIVLFYYVLVIKKNPSTDNPSNEETENSI